MGNMVANKPLTSLKLRRFDVSIPTEDCDRLTGLCLRNTTNRSSLGWVILHQWLDLNDEPLQEHYSKLAAEQNKPVWEIEHEILGIYKRTARSSPSDTAGIDTVVVKMSIPSWDNRRLIGHAHLNGVPKTEMWRRAVLPWLRSQDEEIAKFWANACQWLNKPLAETKALMTADFEDQGR